MVNKITKQGPKPGHQPLRCSVEKNDLVIRIGIKTLAHSAEHCPDLVDYPRNQWPPYATVTDVPQFAEDVVRELNHEKEDGSSPLTELFDSAIVRAFEEGSTGIVIGDVCVECDGTGRTEDHDDCKHCDGTGSEPEPPSKAKKSTR